MHHQVTLLMCSAAFSYSVPQLCCPPSFLRRRYFRIVFNKSLLAHLSISIWNNETCGQLNLLSGHETAVQFFSSVPSVQSWKKRRLYNYSHPYTISTVLKQETAVQLFSPVPSVQSWKRDGCAIFLICTVSTVLLLSKNGFNRVTNPVHSRFRIHSING